MSTTYLSMWANQYPDFRSQHDACSVMIRQDSAYTLLPVRMDEDVSPCLALRSNFTFTVNKFYGGNGFWRHKSYIVHTRFAFARQLYRESVLQLMTEYPNIEDFEFGSRREDGIYPITWKYSPSVLKERLYEIMHRKLSDGFNIDEFVRVEFEEKNGNHNYKFYGALEIEKSDLEDLIYSYPEEYIRKMPLKKGIRYTFEECKEFYREFSDGILELGNQPRAYSASYEENADLFEAAQLGDFDGMVRYARLGQDLNAMDEDGNTPFCWFAAGMIEKKDENGSLSAPEREQLDTLIDLGANPAMYGIGINARSPLAVAAHCGNLDAVKYLLSKGVDPLYYHIKDDENTEGFTAAEDAGAQYLSEADYRGTSISPIHTNYLEISRLLSRKA